MSHIRTTKVKYLFFTTRAHNSEEDDVNINIILFQIDFFPFTQNVFPLFINNNEIDKKIENEFIRHLFHYIYHRRMKSSNLMHILSLKL